MSDQALDCLVAGRQDLDPHVAVLDHLTLSLVPEELPKLLRRAVDFECVAMILHDTASSRSV